jgi:hypothetical protein
VTEPLAVLLLPRRLEDFELSAHARALLAIPRVIAVEPRRPRKGWRVSDVAAIRQARRLRFPGEPRVIVLYHPSQYPLARGLCARYQQIELWYVRTLEAASTPPAEDNELAELDQLAQQRAIEVRVICEPADLEAAEEALRLRMRELEIISHRPFVPGARVERR